MPTFASSWYFTADILCFEPHASLKLLDVVTLFEVFIWILLVTKAFAAMFVFWHVHFDR